MLELFLAKTAISAARKPLKIKKILSAVFQFSRKLALFACFVGRVLENKIHDFIILITYEKVTNLVKNIMGHGS